MVVGGGIVGLAVAREVLVRDTTDDVVVLEKEDQVGAHQTGHNSGVVHAGIYYRTGSLKATLCRRGVSLLREYCAGAGVVVDPVGKVIVATTADEHSRLDPIYERAIANRVPDVVRVNANGLAEIEPHVVGIGGVYSPTTAVVDFGAVARALAKDVAERGGRVRTGSEALGFARTSRGVEVRTRTGNVVADRVVLCPGLYADRVAALAGHPDGPWIVPFRGEYYQVVPERADLVRGLIYPVPDPRYPFLGVHLTRRVDGSVDVGPNAVWALAREGYRWRDVRAGDVAGALRSPGFRALARQHWRTGVRELAGSVSKRWFLAAARRYVPELRPGDLRRGPAGVRAQAVDRDGTLVEDFRIRDLDGVLAVRNAPSPAATSALAIAEHVADHLR